MTEDVVQPEHHERSQVVPEGRLPVSEFAAEVQGGLSPFGEDLELPLPTDAITYHHPTDADRPHLAGEEG
jgi:succinate dehydrogenase / fumarate reductase, iron-sulfur subunit